MNRLRRPFDYRNDAVFQIAKALDEARVIADPDDLERLADAVFDRLSAQGPDTEGWLLIHSEAHRVAEVIDSWEDDGHRRYDVLVESDWKEDPEDG